ncbi:MAG: DUF3540 domain-containing protein [Saccharospirillum sp.]
MTSQVISMVTPGAQCQMEEARVHSVVDQEVLLMTSNGVEPASLAVSCLVRPQVQDWVLVSRSARALYVLSVLSRGDVEQTGVTLGFSGPLTVHTPSDITLTSRSAHWLNERTQVSTGELSVAAADIHSVSKTLSATSGAVRLVSQSLDVISERIARYAQTLISRIRGSEVRQAGQVSEQVINTHMQQSRQTVVDARQDLRINAERIHMG